MLPEWLRQYLIERGLPANATDAEARAYLRQHGAPDYTVRELAIPRDAQRRPLSWDETTRSVEVVVTSETPVQVYDWQRDEVVDEVLLMDGLEPPKQTPLLDAHNRWSVTSQLGSARDYRVQGTEVLARISFADTATARDAANLMRDGHLTDVSVGARLDRNKAVIVPKGEKVKVGAREFAATTRSLILHRGWQIREVSVVPIGADPTAKARSFVPVPHTPNRSTAMPKWLRTRCEALGLPTTATEDEAWRFFNEHQNELLREAPPAGQAAPTLLAPPAAAQPPASDETAIRAAAVKTERERVTAIRNLCQRFSQEPAVVERFINDGCTIEEVERTVAQTFLQQLAAQPRAHFQAVPGGDERDKLRAAASDGVLLRAGVRLEKPAAGATELAGYSLRELARHMLLRSGQPVPSGMREMIERALSTSDFQYVLSTSATKSLAQGFAEEPAGWRLWAAIGGGISDFKTHTENRVYEVSAFAQVAEGAEYKFGTRSEKPPESYQLGKYGQRFAITEETIRNDDLGALTDMPRQYGEEAARLVADVVYAVLTTNGAMGDTKALFHTDHSNIKAQGQGGAPGTSTFDAAELAMTTQKDGGGRRRLSIEPQFFVAPKALRGTAEVFFSTDRFKTGSDVATVANRWFKRVQTDFNSRLDDALTTGWYLLGPKGRTVVVRFLDGRETPELWTKEGWTVDGVEMKARIGVVAYAVDWRAMYFNYGA